MDLVEVLTELTGPIATATHNRGQVLINGIYVTPLIIPAITGGYLAFEAGIPSNHRALWIDVPGEVLVGLNDSNTPRKPSAQQLQCKDPKVIKKYLTNLTTYLTQENVFNWIEHSPQLWHKDG